MKNIAARKLLTAAATLAWRRCSEGQQGGNAAGIEDVAKTVRKTFLIARIHVFFRLIEVPENSCGFVVRIADDVVIIVCRCLSFLNDDVFVAVNPQKLLVDEDVYVVIRINKHVHV